MNLLKIALLWKFMWNVWTALNGIKRIKNIKKSLWAKFHFKMNILSAIVKGETILEATWGSTEYQSEKLIKSTISGLEWGVY